MEVYIRWERHIVQNTQVDLGVREEREAFMDCGI